MYLTVMTHQAAKKSVNLDLISVVTFSSYASDIETGDLRKTVVVDVGLGLVVVG